MIRIRNRLLVGDAGAGLRQLPPRSVDMLLTSPPYFRLRRYRGAGNELGVEAAVDEWVERILAVSREVARVLTPTGTLWLNLGDSYSAAEEQGAPRKSLLLGPERVALQLIASGWVLRNKIVWTKPNPMPTSVRDRLACTWEYVYLFARSPDYFFDLDAIREPHRTAERPSPTGTAPPDGVERWRGPNTASRLGLRALKAAGHVGHPLGKNPGDTWVIASSHYRSSHRATFPVGLARRAIEAGCPEAVCERCQTPWRRRVVRTLGGGVVRSRLGPCCECGAPGRRGLVLDPFIGSGTTAVAAEALGRDWLGIELNAAYAAEADARIQSARAGPRAA